MQKHSFELSLVAIVIIGFAALFVIRANMQAEINNCLAKGNNWDSYDLQCVNPDGRILSE